MLMFLGVSHDRLMLSRFLVPARISTGIDVAYNLAAPDGTTPRRRWWIVGLSPIFGVEEVRFTVYGGTVVCDMEFVLHDSRIWMFPKMVVPPNHPFSIGFSIINHPFGVPLFLETPICLFWLSGDSGRDGRHSFSKTCTR